MAEWSTRLIQNQLGHCPLTGSSPVGTTMECEVEIMSKKRYRIWTTPADGSENGRWDRQGKIFDDKEDCEGLARTWRSLTAGREIYEVREYLGD